jgi:hypothetical protein
MTSHCTTLHHFTWHYFALYHMHARKGWWGGGVETRLISLASASIHMMPCHSICFILDGLPFLLVSLYFYMYQFGLISLHLFVLWLWPWLWLLWLLLWLWPAWWAQSWPCYGFLRCWRCSLWLWLWLWLWLCCGWPTARAAAAACVAAAAAPVPAVAVAAVAVAVVAALASSMGAVTGTKYSTYRHAYRTAWKPQKLVICNFGGTMWKLTFQMDSGGLQTKNLTFTWRVNHLKTKVLNRFLALQP